MQKEEEEEAETSSYGTDDVNMHNIVNNYHYGTNKCFHCRQNGNRFGNIYKLNGFRPNASNQFGS